MFETTKSSPCTIKWKKFIGILLLGYVMALCLSGTILRDKFIVYPESESQITLTVINTAQKNPKSLSTDCRIKEIKSDLYTVPIFELKEEPWSYKDGYFQTLSPKTETSFSLTIPAKEYVEFHLIKQEGSGIVEILVNDVPVETIDLYSKSWEDLIWNYSLGTFSFTNNLFLIVGLGLVCALVLYLVIKGFKQIKTNLAAIYTEADRSKSRTAKKILSSTDTGIITAISASYLLTIYAPLEMLFTNQDEFWFDLQTVFPVCLLLFCIFSIICIILLSLVYLTNVKGYKAIVIFMAVFTICTYIQGNYLINQLPPLDGTSISWNQFGNERLKTLLVWCVISSGIWIIAKRLTVDKLFRGLRYGGIVFLLFINVTLIMVGITTKGYGKKLEMVPTVKNMLEMSNDTNFIILVLDAVDAGTLSQVVEENPEYESVFDDFTYYENTLGAYTYTKHSIPFILSGDWYENKGAFNEYVNSSIQDSQLFSELEAERYKMALYDHDLKLDANVFNGDFDNMVISQGKVKSYTKFTSLILQLAGIKYAPYDLKHFFYDSPSQLEQVREVSTDAGDKLFYWENPTFYKRLQEEPITTIDDKCFKFIHLEGAHVPYRYDKNLNLISNGTYKDNIEASITLVKGYLEKLKEGNVYDNSVIIILSDHGYSELANARGRQNPALFVKGINEKHEMNVDHAPISYADLQTAYQRLLAGKESKESFDYKEGDTRERRFLLYIYLNDNHMVEYIQKGHASDLDTMFETGNIFDSSK